MKWKRGFGASLIPLNLLLLFFLVFESRLVVPSWLQVFGRMHPLVLHFPIVLVILYGVWVLVAARGRIVGSGEIAEILLLSAAFTSVITALMGLLLSREPGYEGAQIGIHKWMGVLTSFGLLCIYNFRDVLRVRPLVSGVSAGLVMLLLLLAGHFGGSITHGENFVL